MPQPVQAATRITSRLETQADRVLGTRCFAARSLQAIKRLVAAAVAAAVWRAMPEFQCRPRQWRRALRAVLQRVVRRSARAKVQRPRNLAAQRSKTPANLHSPSSGVAVARTMPTRRAPRTQRPLVLRRPQSSRRRLRCRPRRHQRHRVPRRPRRLQQRPALQRRLPYRNQHQCRHWHQHQRRHRHQLARLLHRPGDQRPLRCRLPS